MAGSTGTRFRPGSAPPEIRPRARRRMLLALLLVAFGAVPACADDDLWSDSPAFRDDGSSQQVDWEFSEPADDSSPRQSAQKKRSEDGFGLDGRIGHLGFKTFGRYEPISHVELFPYVIDGERMFFSDLRFFVNNQGYLGGNAGLGYRWRIREWDRVHGVSLWYDGDKSTNEFFNQVALNLESYGRRWDFRSNFYLPVGEIEQDLDLQMSNVRFSGNSILFDEHRDFARAMKGVDGEIGFLVPTELAEKHNLRAYLGGYYFTGGGERIHGYKVRLEGRLYKAITSRVEYTEDDEFGQNVMLGVAVNFSTGVPRHDLKASSNHERLRRFVERNYNIIVDKQTETRVGVPAVNPATGSAYVVQHVASGGGAGSGTVLDPFNNFADAQAAGGDIIFTHADSTFNTPLVMNANERILGEGVTHLFAIEGYQNLAVLPRATDGTNLPALQNVAGDAVTLASGAILSGFVIDSPTGAGLLGNGVDSATVSHVDIRNAGGHAVSLTGSTGTFTFSNLDVSGAAGAGVFVDGGDAAMTFSGTLANTAGRAVQLQNTTGGSLGFDLLTIDDNGGQGLLLSNLDGDASFGTVDVAGSTTTGIDIQGGSGEVAFNGTTTITQAAAAGVSVQNQTGPVTFDDLDVEADGQVGLFARNADLLINDGTIDAVNGGGAVDVEDSNLTVGFTSISSDGGAFGIRLVNNTGQFVVVGEGTSGSGGLIQNAATGALIANSGSVGLQFVDFDANTVGIQATDHDNLVLIGNRITNSTNFGVDLLSVRSASVSGSGFSGNGTNSIRIRVDDATGYAYQINNNNFTETGPAAIALSTIAGGEGSSLTFTADTNLFTLNGAGTEAVSLSWDGVIDAVLSNNVVAGTGGGNVGFNLNALSATETSEFTVFQNSFDFDGGNDTAVAFNNAGPSLISVGPNVINFDGADGTGLDFTLAENSTVTVFSNAITDNVSGGTGILFQSIDGPSTVAINDNIVDLLSPGGAVDRGVIFTTVNGTIDLVGDVNNIINGATTDFFIPAGTSNGQILINGVLVP